MKYLYLLLIFTSVAFGSIIKSQIVSIDELNKIATIKIDKIDIGMSGFIIHKISDNHSVILKSIEVKSYNTDTKTATLGIDEYTVLKQNSLPSGTWHVKIGDTAVLAFGYSRGFLVAPNEDIYYRITKSTKNFDWVHPDLFATILSFNGHPTPLKEDFVDLSTATSVGVIFIYLDKKVFTIDSKSFKILSISEAPLVQDTTKLPFFTRVEKIEANWWGDGSDELKDYEPHYYELLVNSNKQNKELYEIIKNGDKKLSYLINKFEIRD